MAQTSIATEESVRKAADALLIAGERPTIEKIRQKLGGGSPNTVLPLLDAWYKELASRMRPADSVPASLRRLWDEARLEAKVAFDSEREAIREEAGKRVEAAETAARNFGTALSAAEARLTQLAEQLADKSRLLAATEARLAAEQSELADERRRSEQAGADLRATLAQLESERATRDTEAAKANLRLDEAMRRAALAVESERQAEVNSQKRYAQLQGRLERHVTEAQEAALRHAEEKGALETQLRVAHSECAAAITRASDAQARVDDLTGQLDSVRQQVAAAGARGQAKGSAGPGTTPRSRQAHTGGVTRLKLRR